MEHILKEHVEEERDRSITFDSVTIEIIKSCSIVLVNMLLSRTHGYQRDAIPQVSVSRVAPALFSPRQFEVDLVKLYMLSGTKVYPQDSNNAIYLPSRNRINFL